MIGLIASIGGSSSFSYTAPSTCKVNITVTPGGNTGSISLNGISFMRFNLPTPATEPQSGTQNFYLGAGQQLNITTGSTFTATISAYEE